MAMRTENLKVSGMTCRSCIHTVTEALKKVRGVGDVTVSLERAKAVVRFDEHVTSAEQLKSAIRDAGYGVDGQGAPAKGKGGCRCA
jgi:copper ion binding protein